VSRLVAAFFALFFLALSRGAPVFADDASSLDVYHPADVNRDGTVTNRESRRYNRRLKRGDGAPRGGGEAGGDPGPNNQADGGVPDDSNAGAVQANSAQGISRANAIAATLTQSLGSGGDAGAMPKNAAKSGAGATKAGAAGISTKPSWTAGSGAGGAGGGSSGGPSNPKTRRIC